MGHAIVHDFCSLLLPAHLALYPALIICNALLCELKRSKNILTITSVVSRPLDMLDPISVAGLALAVFDQLLKLGERTAEAISDIRSFDQVSYSVYASEKMSG